MSQIAGRAARRAVDIIEEYGWGQGKWIGSNGVCVRGAFNVAVWGNAAMPPSAEEQEFAAWMVDIGALNEMAEYPLLSSKLATWNDDENRTKEEVLAYLNKFAEEQDPQPVLP